MIMPIAENWSATLRRVYAQTMQSAVALLTFPHGKAHLLRMRPELMAPP